MKTLLQAGLFFALAGLTGCTHRVEKTVVETRPPIVVERTVPSDRVIIEDRRVPVIREGRTTIIER